MISVSEARELVRRSLSALSAELIPARDSVGRVIAEDVNAREDSPGFDNSAMDGYAVRFADLQNLPATLEIEFEVPAGTQSPPDLPPGKAARIFTGAILPGGADTVIMQENVEQSGNSIAVSMEPKCGSHIRRQGEDLQVGQPLLSKGAILTAPWFLCLLRREFMKSRPFAGRLWRI